MDMVQGQMPQGEQEGANTGAMVCLTFVGDRVMFEQVAPGQAPTGQGKEMDIGSALKAVLDAFEGQEDGGDQFAAGLREGSPQGEPKPTTNGMRIG